MQTTSVIETLTGKVRWPNDWTSCPACDEALPVRIDPKIYAVAHIQQRGAT